MQYFSQHDRETFRGPLDNAKIQVLQPLVCTGRLLQQAKPVAVFLLTHVVCFNRIVKLNLTFTAVQWHKSSFRLTPKTPLTGRSVVVLVSLCH